MGSWPKTIGIFPTYYPSDLDRYLLIWCRFCWPAELMILVGISHHPKKSWKFNCSSLVRIPSWLLDKSPWKIFIFLAKYHQNTGSIYQQAMLVYPPGNDHISHQTEVGKSIDSKVPPGMGDVSSQESTPVCLYNIHIRLVFWHIELPDGLLASPLRPSSSSSLVKRNTQPD